jgi:FemAB-related protein (PEP-CTERM system-associated)
MSDRRTASLNIGYLEPDQVSLWDAFVDRSPEATFFHRAGWKQVIENSFRHRCYFLCAWSGGQVHGVLPLVHVRSRIFGNALISNAFCVCGGPVAADSDALHALDEAAKGLARELHVDYLEYRTQSPLHPDWACNAELYASFRRRLDPNPEKDLLAIPRKRRAEIRKGMKAGLQSEVNRDVGCFYRIYSESIRNLGTPVFGKRYFENLMAVFGEHCDVLTITQGGRSLSSVMNFYFRDQVLPYYGGGTGAARQTPANDFMYWELMRRAAERGIEVFDFGRSKRGTGAFAYKKNWGFEASPLYHEYFLVEREEIPSVNPLDPKYRPFIAVWRQLPLWLANLIGPKIARNLG